MAVHLVRTGIFPSVHSLCAIGFLSESLENPLVAQSELRTTESFGVDVRILIFVASPFIQL